MIVFIYKSENFFESVSPPPLDKKMPNFFQAIFQVISKTRVARIRIRYGAMKKLGGIPQDFGTMWRGSEKMPKYLVLNSKHVLLRSQMFLRMGGSTQNYGSEAPPVGFRAPKAPGVFPLKASTPPPPDIWPKMCTPAKVVLGLIFSYF